MTTAVLDEDLVLKHAVASGHDDWRRVLRDRGHQLRAARRRSTLPRLKHASARPTFCSGHRRAVGSVSSQVRSGDYDTGARGDGGVVCLANGTTKRIADVHEGDKVLARNPETGKNEERTVTATTAHDDNDLLDLTIVDGDGHHGVLQTTDHHKIWSVTADTWVLASELNEGDQLSEPDGTTATLVEATKRPGHEQMLDLTVDTDHTFYVDYGGQAILVHNCNPLTTAETFKLGNLAGDADKTAADMIRARGGGASQVNQLQTGYGQMTLRDLAHSAVGGDAEAEKAIKMIKQAGSQGKGGK